MAIKDKRTTSTGIAVIMAALPLGIISALGLTPMFKDKAVLLHFPALIISVFLLGIGLTLITGLSGTPKTSQTTSAEGDSSEPSSN